MEARADCRGIVDPSRQEDRRPVPAPWRHSIRAWPIVQVLVTARQIEESTAEDASANHARPCREGDPGTNDFLRRPFEPASSTLTNDSLPAAHIGTLRAKPRTAPRQSQTLRRLRPYGGLRARQRGRAGAAGELIFARPAPRVWTFGKLCTVRHTARRGTTTVDPTFRCKVNRTY